MNNIELRRIFSEFWMSRQHVEVLPAPLVLQNDATTLFTSSGMQPLVAYLAGEAHPLGKRLFNIQPGIRMGDIDEVGDNRHTTFFEMMGNWSLGDYFKKEQVKWKWELLTERLGLPKEKIHVTVFEGGFGVEKDNDTAEIWRMLGLSEENIHFYDVSKNWWSRSGPPDAMPVGEIGGPSSEVFYDFGLEHDTEFGPRCHPNCDCGRFLEICNSVFIQYRKIEGNKLVDLPQKNVDFGGGLERMLAAINDDPDIFKTDVIFPIVKGLERTLGVTYGANAKINTSMRIIADHMRASAFLIHDGVVPSNKEHGYILRRLIRRSAMQTYQIRDDISELHLLTDSVKDVFAVFKDIYLRVEKREHIEKTIDDEIKKFSHTLKKGFKMLDKMEQIDAHSAFNLFQSFGFPVELTKEIASQRGQVVDIKEFSHEKAKHKNESRTASSGKFKGGLADHSAKVVKYHTATHLLHQALKDIFGQEARQEGSNITQERLRFDVRLQKKPTEEEISKVEEVVNKKIVEDLPVYSKVLARKEADKIGAASFFNEKYGDEVNVYFIGGDDTDPSLAYSKEFCGGPHVHRTGEIGKITIFKVKKIGTQLVRIYAK